MPPHAARAKRSVQSVQVRAWERSISRLKELGGKVLHTADRSLPLTELSTCVDDLDLLIHRSDDQRPGAWAALIKSGGAACLLALYSVTLRCSCESLTPSVSSSLRSLHASLRVRLANELGNVVEDSDGHISKRDVRSLVRGLFDTHVLRCYAALLSDALRPLTIQFREQQQEGEQPPQQPPRLSPHRRAAQALSELLLEARDVVSFLRDAYDACKDVEADPPGDLMDRIGPELTSSGLLEFWCRGALLLAACESHERTAAVLVESFFCVLHNLKAAFSDVAGLQRLNPSLSLLLASHMTQLLAALDGGSLYGLPPAAARWSAPLLAPLLPPAGGAAAAPGPQSGGRRPPPRQLDFDDGTAAVLHLASLTLWAWSTALTDEASGKFGSSLQAPPLDGVKLLAAAAAAGTAAAAAAAPLVPSAGAAGAAAAGTTAASTTAAAAAAPLVPSAAAAAAAGTTAAAAAAPLVPSAALPPRSLRQACNAYLKRLDRSAALLGTTVKFIEAKEDEKEGTGGGAGREGRAVGPWAREASEMLLEFSFTQQKDPEMVAGLTKVRLNCLAEMARTARLMGSVQGPPLNAVAVLDVCLRLTAVAWETLRLDRSHSSHPPERQQGQGPRPLRLTSAAAVRLAAQALTCAKAASNLISDLAGRMEVPARALRLMEACWREWLAWAGLKAGCRGAAAARALGESEWNQVGVLVAMEYSTCTLNEAVPSALTPAATAAIAAGYAPSFERLVRRLHGANRIECASLIATVLDCKGRAVGWELLLGHAPLPDVTRLLATLCEVVRQVASDLQGSPAGTAAAASRTGPPQRCSFVDTIWRATELHRCAEALLLCYKGSGVARLRGGASDGGPAAAAAAEGDAGSSGGGAPAAGPEEAAIRQTQVVLSYVAVRMLPAFAELFQRVMWAVRRGVITRDAPCMAPMLLWVPVLCVAAADCAAPAAAGAASPVGGGDAERPATASATMPAGDAGPGRVDSGQDGDGGGGVTELRSWADVLLHDVDVFGVLRAYVPGRSFRDWVAEDYDPIHDAVVGLAAFLPRQLAAALKDSPTSGSPQADATDPRVSDATAAAGAAAAAATGSPPLWKGLSYLFGPNGPRSNPNLWALLLRLRISKEEEEEVDTLAHALLPPPTSTLTTGVSRPARQGDGSAGGASESRPLDEATVTASDDAANTAAAAAPLPPLPPHLRSWLSVLELRGVLDAAKLAAWREAAALLPRGAPDAAALAGGAASAARGAGS
ncbi:hypothetical protein PLESTB_000643800 [Pleodorina starrii]|uniref:Uncharacterized protein n=1 Tax=Pleodorina starrii TaxID=330485 RepID=A0A9W6BJH7_9CHLO|nr:hypothetical protein PLESTM_001305100 [Pleodorina starrii]GLC52566.1 hypothetical protein PLESTB_000643800 [Pleodorina starrii]GLC71566.1 hypothetical protein PLESTF_001136000 [Pleodorina starrii]